jgi:hypothetical protein
MRRAKELDMKAGRYKVEETAPVGNEPTFTTQKRPAVIELVRIMQTIFCCLLFRTFAASRSHGSSS